MWYDHDTGNSDSKGIRVKSIAFIGSAGVPNRYGGFEAFLESCGPLFARRRKILVTCDARRYMDKTGRWNGVHRVFVNIPANGPLSVAHDLVAFFTVVWRVNVVVVLGVSAGLAFPLMRGVSSLLGVRLIVNVDGVEWRRSKFSGALKLFLRASDRLAQQFSNNIVYDNEALLDYIPHRHRSKSKCIAYSGDQVGGDSSDIEDGNALTICRIEPENNCHLLLEGFLTAGRGRYTFIGNWNDSAYGLSLRSRFGGDPRLTLLDPVYDPALLHELRSRCDVYLHGHSVGGTNPSLVEMLYYNCSILAYDCEFNRYTAGSQAAYFDDVESLVQKLSNRICRPLHNAEDIRKRYTRAQIVAQYEALIDTL